MSVGADGLQFLAVLGQFNGFFGCKDDSFTVPLFLDGFQKIFSKNMIREVKLSQN